VAALTIFHGGLNTALESLAQGVPMVALPVTIDQPGVGAPIKRTHRHVDPGPAPFDALLARGHRRGLDGSKLVTGRAPNVLLRGPLATEFCQLMPLCDWW
jgi:UDP-glucoronosyl and UDP-glucosyl transferase